MDTLSYEWWIVIAVVLFILELCNTGFLLTCFGIGALGASIPSMLGLGIAWQLACFAIVSLLALKLLRPMLSRSMHRRGGNTPTGMDALVGRRVVVQKPFAPYTEHGEIAVDGDVWRATVEGGQPLESGQVVEIVAYESLVLRVRPVVED